MLFSVDLPRFQSLYILSLVAPQNLAEKMYEELVETLSKHLAPKPLVIDLSMCHKIGSSLMLHL